MPSNLLTLLECKNATCQTASLRKLHDGDGLYLWVYPDGRKYWRLRYWQEGKEKSLSLGVFDGKAGVTLKEARTKRDALRKQMESGLDPSAERKAEASREKAPARRPARRVPRSAAEDCHL
jgi:hypothetical protein